MLIYTISINRAVLSICTLYEEQLYIKLINRCVSDYKSIYKHQEINLDNENIRTTKDFWDQMAHLMIEKIGQNGAVDLVEELDSKVSALKRYYK